MRFSRFRSVFLIAGFLALVLVAGHRVYTPLEGFLAASIQQPQPDFSLDVNLDLSEGAGTARNALSIEADETPADQVLGQDLEADGEGFYLSIYRDTVATPNKRVEEAVKRRFGIDFKLDLMPSVSEQGPYVFTDFFREQDYQIRASSRPRLTDSLQSACVRIRATQAQDEEIRLRILKQRLEERRDGLSGDLPDPPAPAPIATQQNITDQALIEELLGRADEHISERFAEALRAIPEYRNLDQQDILASCYADFSTEVDFELRLQRLLHPSKKKLEVLHTFVNGRLDDFESSLPGTDIPTGNAFPLYDLIFDLEVIDLIIFGSPVSTDGAPTGAGGRFPGGSGGRSVGSLATPSDLRTYEDILERSSPPTPEEDGSEDEREAPEGFRRLPNGELVPVDPDASEGFGSKSGAFAGPFCPDDIHQGLDLDLSPLDEDDQDGTSQDGDGTSADDDGDGDGSGTGLGPGAGGQGTGTAGPGDEDDDDSAQLAEGRSRSGLNIEALCEGTIGVDFGNEFMRLLFCITISFEKQGKSWTSVRDENCIACHIYRINQVFEEFVLTESVRPHKNTGTIMESGICEDGYGDDIGFHFFLEVVPVQFYPSICYPKGGVTDSQYAEMVGYPELLARLNKPGYEVACETDFTDEEGREKCREALGGDTANYDQLKQAYLATININQPITDFDDLPEDNLWVKLAGAQGIAERELHLFLYRSGTHQPRFDEEERVEQDFKKRLETIDKVMDLIQKDESLIVNDTQDQKLVQLLCVKGTTLETQTLNCNTQQYFQEAGGETPDDTLIKIRQDMDKERQRLARLTGTWNEMSRDFNGENECAVFEGSGPVDAFWSTFKDDFSLSYFLDTPARSIQSPREQLTPQISANMDIQDLNNLLTTIEEEVQDFAEKQRRQEQQEATETDQSQSLQIAQALGREFSTFRSLMRGLTLWWAQMVDNKQFVSKSGEAVNVLDSFLEKAGR